MSVGIVADDFGYCPNRNRAILHAYRAGAITDTSLLVNANYVDSAVTMASKCKLPMGLHFNMSEGKPVSDPANISSLLTEDGEFLGKAGTLEAARNRKLLPEHVKTELAAQIEKFKALTGYYPRRVDGHQHVHVFPVINTVFANVLESYEIRISRLPEDQTLDQATWVAEFPSSYEFLSKVAKFAAASRPIFSKHSIKCADSFLGSSLMNFGGKMNLTVANIARAVGTLPATCRSCELMVHPGYPCVVEDGGCGIGPDDFSKDVAREWELETLISDRLADFLLYKQIRKRSLEKLL